MKNAELGGQKENLNKQLWIDTVFKEINIIQLSPKKIINKIDNSIRNKAKDNSAIGDNNELKKTTKKSQWWWIFIAGFLSAHLLRFALQRFKVI